MKAEKEKIAKAEAERKQEEQRKLEEQRRKEAEKAAKRVTQEEFNDDSDSEKSGNGHPGLTPDGKNPIGITPDGKTPDGRTPAGITAEENLPKTTDPKSSQKSDMTEEDMAEKAKNSIKDCCAYVEKYGNRGKYISDVRAKFRQLYARKLALCKTAEDYQRFLNEHDGIMKRMRLDGSSDDRSFRNQAENKLKELKSSSLPKSLTPGDGGRPTINGKPKREE